jgi:hypothetical protein
VLWHIGDMANALTKVCFERREFIALMGATVAWPFAALAQEPARTY